MNLLKKIRDWQDKRFLKRLERVMQNNVINAHLGIGGDISYCLNAQMPPSPVWQKEDVKSCKSQEESPLFWKNIRNEMDEIHLRQLSELSHKYGSQKEK